jgi:hypothetical protein
MPFYEYKKHRTPDGQLVNPGFIERDEWSNLLPENNTCVCYIPPESKRDYYVPDTLVQLTKEEFIARVGRMPTDDADATAIWAEEYWSDFEALDNN